MSTPTPALPSSSSSSSSSSSPLPTVQIPNLPDAAYYIPSFLHPDEESKLLHKVLSAPQPTWRHLSHRRLQAHPSPLSPQTNTLLDLQGKKGLPEWLTDPIVSRIKDLRIGRRIDGEEGIGMMMEEGEGVFAQSPHGGPNHCLVNEYLPGQGIHPHQDGDAYFPVVCTVSLGSHTVLDVRRKAESCQPDDYSPAARDRRDSWRILQEPRSLLITTGQMYLECLHGIEGVEVDGELNREEIANWDMLGHQGEYAEGWKRRQTRISLTYRDVVRVKKVGKAFGGLLK